MLDCFEKYRLLSVHILLMAVLVFNSSDAQAEVHVYDNNNQYLGIMTEAEYYPYVEVQIPFTTPVALPLRFEVRTRTVVIPLN